MAIISGILTRVTCFSFFFFFFNVCLFGWLVFLFGGGGRGGGGGGRRWIENFPRHVLRFVMQDGHIRADGQADDRTKTVHRYHYTEPLITQMNKKKTKKTSMHHLHRGV